MKTSTSDNRKSFLIVGLGSMGKRRIRNLRTLGVESIVGFDVSPERRDEAREKYSIEVVSNLKSLQPETMKAFIICTPPDLHMDYANLAASLGLHVFTEAGTSIEGMQELIDLTEKKGIVAAPSCTFRFHPAIRKIFEVIRDGDLGTAQSFTHHCGQYLPDWHPWEDYRNYYVSQRSTGACREIVAFELNWLTWLFKEKPTTLACIKSKVSDLECDIDDIYQVILNFQNKIVGHLQVDVLARTPTRFLRILCSEGVIEWSMIDKVLRLYDTKKSEWQHIIHSPTTVETGYSEMSNEQMYIDEMKAFVDAINQKSTFLHNFTRDKAILDLLLACDKSSNSLTHSHPLTL